MMKRTPLYHDHVALGGKMVEFAGWEMPVQYPAGLINEHVCVRTQVGLFDVSHMGEIWVTGPEAEKALDYLTCNKVKNLYDGRAHYSALLNDTGGVIDDIIIYRFNAEKYLICVNASNAEADFAWLSSRNPTSAQIHNASAEFGQIAVQGPKAVELLSRLLPKEQVEGTKYFHFFEGQIAGTPVIAARTGYTGEDGYEVFVPTEQTASLWKLLVDKGQDLGVLPCGLGARDSLRLEAALPLHGHELSPELFTALESGLGWIVKLDKGDFIGKAALERQQSAGVPRKLVGFELDEPGIARFGDGVSVAGEADKVIGRVTSGTKTPTVNKAIGMAIVDAAYTAPNSKISLVVRGRAIAGHAVPLPFYKRK